MITIERVKDLPDLPYTQKAIEQTGGTLSFIDRYAKHIWVVRDEDTPLFVAGIYRLSLLEPPEFWVLICEGAKGRFVLYLAAMKSLLSIVIRYHKRLKVRVEKADRRARRLVEHTGFTFWQEDSQYYWYEVKI